MAPYLVSVDMSESATMTPYLYKGRWAIVYVCTVHWWHVFVSLRKYISFYFNGVMVADSFMSTEIQIGTHTLPPYTIVQ